MNKMSKSVKSIFAVILALTLATAFTATVNAAEDELTVNSEVKAKKGDKITYAVNLADCNLDVLGITMSVFYDDEYLRLDPDSITYEKLDGVVQNPNLDGYFKFTWTDINNLQDFSKKAMLVSADFEVLKPGETEISYFITDLYGDLDKMETLSSYTLTCDISLNGEVVSKDKTPIVNEDKSDENKMQGDFINYVDGMGEDNTPNKDDHKSVVVSKYYITQVQEKAVDVTRTPDAADSDGASPVAVVVIIVIVIVALAIAAVVIVKRRDNSKSADASISSDEPDKAD